MPTVFFPRFNIADVREMKTILLTFSHNFMANW